MPNKRHARLAWIAAFALLLSLPAIDLVAGPKATKKKTTRKAAAPRVVDPAISTVDGLRVLTLSGTPRERGKTHGRALANDIFKLIDEFLKASHLSGGPRMYEMKLPQVTMAMSIPPLYREEMEGMLEGMTEARKGKMRVKALKRDLTLDDLVALTSIADSVGFGCSSFGAWGSLTKSGDTIVARNLDWHYIPSLAKMQLIIVHMPDKENNRLGWVSVGWPGQIGCYTGMNEQGVTVSMHDVNAGMPEQMSGFTPRALILRDAIEHARAESAEDDIFGVLRNHTVLVGNNIPVGVPYVEGAQAPPFMVFEYDGRRNLSGGVQLNQADRLRTAADAIAAAGEQKTEQFGIATNHYCSRSSPTRCNRYERLEKALKSRVEDAKPLTVNDAFKMLGTVGQTTKGDEDGLVTYHAVVFEPKRRTMKVAFSKGKASATKSRLHSLSLLTLLK